MLYPNRLRAVLVFDRPVHNLEAVVHSFARIEGMKSGASFAISEDDPAHLYRLFNDDEDLKLSFEYCNAPANAKAFNSALSSRFTELATPDIHARLDRGHYHIALDVSQGLSAGSDDDPAIAATVDIGHAQIGATLAQFQRRLALLALMTRITAEYFMPQAVHWTQSDMLIGGEHCDALAAVEAPGPLHIHPLLFGPQSLPDEPALVGIRTFGARHWLGREILIKPNVLPWKANYDTILAFLRVATTINGYVIPDGDTFGPEDRSLSYRVLHHDVGADIGYCEAEPADLPMFELVPMKYLAHDFVAPDHVPNANAIDDRAFPAQMMPADQDDKAALANEWGAKRKLAEGIGGALEIRARSVEQSAPRPPSPSPPISLAERRPAPKTFGRKGL